MGLCISYMPKERILWIADGSGFEKSVKRGLKFSQWYKEWTLRPSAN
jgi:hypothetical protein